MRGHPRSEGTHPQLGRRPRPLGRPVHELERRHCEGWRLAFVDEREGAVGELPGVRAAHLARALMVTCELLDISGNNPLAIDFIKVRAAGVVGVYVKATEGVAYVDPHLATYEQHARAADVPVFLYHYLRVRHGVPQ